MQASARRMPWVMITLAVANLAVFAWQLAQGADLMQPSAAWMLDHGGNFGPLTLDGEEWRLVSSMFLHYGLLHIAMNMIGLVDGGRHVERMYGPAGFAALYLVSGLAASLATSLRAGAVSAGASGAVFGVFGAFGAFLFLHRERLDRAEVGRQARGLLIFLAYNIYFGLTTEGIDLVAHVGGLIAGFVVGLALEAGTGEDPSTARRSLLVAVIGIALVAGGAFLAPRPGNAFTALGEAEETVLGRWNQLVGQAKAGSIGDREMAEVIEKELLPPWRAMHEEYRREGEGEMKTLVLDYLAARQEGWEIMARGLRADDSAEVERGMKRFAEGDAAIARLQEGAD